MRIFSAAQAVLIVAVSLAIEAWAVHRACMAIDRRVWTVMSRRVAKRRNVSKRRRGRIGLMSMTLEEGIAAGRVEVEEAAERLAIEEIADDISRARELVATGVSYEGLGGGGGGGAGSPGGLARAAALSPERRREIAMMGVEAKRKRARELGMT